MRKPNLIIFLPDQQRVDTIGNPKVHAPNLNKLAAESVVFERAYVTHPVCTPSRSALLTGLWPHQTGCTRNGLTLDPRFRILPELLGDPDYYTAYMGKWHLGPNGFLERGFREWIPTEGPSPYADFLKAHGQKPDKPNGAFSKIAVSHLPLELSKPKFLETKACEFIRRHRHEPFLLFVAYVEPHSPYNGPLNDEHPLDEMDIDLTANIPNEDEPLRYRLMREWQEEEAALDRQRHPLQYFFGTTPDEYREIKQRYLGLVTLVDLSIGGILKCLDDVDLAGDTIVVHTSDHGDTLGAHRLFGKEVMYEEATRVPWLIRLPERQARRIAEPVSHIDFVPTLLDLLGRPKIDSLPGKSLLPRMRGESVDPQNVFIEWAPNRIKTKAKTTLARRRDIKRAVSESTRTVVTPDGWKLSRRDGDLNELYNLNDDPHETRNLCSDERYQTKVGHLTDVILRWQRSVADSLAL